MNTFLTMRITTLACAMILLLSACNKAEFMPEPIGEEIAPPIYPTFLESLPQQTGLFKSMWLKAGMDEVLATEQAQAKLTFLVPDDGAMEEAGYSAEKIQTMDKTMLQNILRYLVLNGAVGLEQLRSAGGDLTLPTLLQHPIFLDAEARDGSLLRTVPYQYQHQIGAKDRQLIVDGHFLEVDQELDVAQGKAFIINKLLSAPQRQMYDFLVQDGRFSLYLKAMDLNNIEYANEFLMNWWGNFPPPIRYMIDWNYYFEGTFHSNEDYPRHIIHGTLLAPTDDAFHQLGIYTEEDLRALNGRIETPMYYEQNQTTPVDSLLKFHFIGRAGGDTGYNPDFTVLCYAVKRDRFTDNSMFFSHMLDDRLLAVHKHVGLRFDHSDNRITVSPLQSNEQPASIIEENINTIQGPVHVLDRILVPDGFSMWHKK